MAVKRVTLSVWPFYNIRDRPATSSSYLAIVWFSLRVRFQCGSACFDACSTSELAFGQRKRKQTALSLAGTPFSQVVSLSSITLELRIVCGWFRYDKGAGKQTNSAVFSVASVFCLIQEHIISWRYRLSTYVRPAAWEVVHHGRE